MILLDRFLEVGFLSQKVNIHVILIGIAKFFFTELLIILYCLQWCLRMPVPPVLPMWSVDKLLDFYNLISEK